MRPDSARGILRQLAKLTAPATKRIVPTPGTVRGKENREPDGEQDDGEDIYEKRPRLTLDIDESLESIEAPDANEDEEEDSELPVAPTPSILPDDEEHGETVDDNPTFTLKSINYPRTLRSPISDRGVSQRSFPASDPVIYHDGDEESTILSERGRRAPTAEPTEAISHYDFGEIQIDEAPHREQPKSLDKTQVDLEDVDNSYVSLEDGGGETEALRHLQDLQRSPSMVPPEDSNLGTPLFDDSNFQLPEPDLETTSNQNRAQPALKLAEASLPEPAVDESEGGWEDEPGPESEAQIDEASEVGKVAEPRATSRGVPGGGPPIRRKKLKLTRHGEMVPSLPSSLIRRVVIEAQARLGNRRPKLGKDHMKALEQATEWYFEQVGEDLAAYSDHARRKKRIDKSDVLLLFKRQRLLQDEGELSRAAKDLLPKEAVANMGLEDLSEA